MIPRPDQTPARLGTGGTDSKRTKLVTEIRRSLASGQVGEAIDLIATIPKKLGGDAELLMLRAHTLEQAGQRAAALQVAKESLAKREHVETLLIAARCSRAAGDTDDVAVFCDRAERLKPGMLQTTLTLAGAYEAAGRFDEAEAVLTPAIDRLDNAGRPWPKPLQVEWSKVLVQRKRYEDAIALIDRSLDDGEMPEQFVAAQYYLRAKACDRSGRYEEAAASATSANRVQKVDFSPDLYGEQVSALIENWSPDNMATFPLSRCVSELPVFVAGMPRSGTSLIDQIIDAHPKASGVGELGSVERFAIDLSRAYDPERPTTKRFGKYDSYRWTRVADQYVKQVTGMAAPGTERVVNKALGNNKLVGLLARLFPKTRIIHAIRDPRDVAISCFMGGFNNKMHAWTTQIDWVAHSWRQSMRMMEHWKASLDIPILDVHYERLVADPENEMPRIIEFLGLEWDDACRDFYKSRRTVRTLSYDQVNRPLYTSSSGRHKNYAGLLGGVEFPEYDPFVRS